MSASSLRGISTESALRSLNPPPPPPPPPSGGSFDPGAPFASVVVSASLGLSLSLLGASLDPTG